MIDRMTSFVSKALLGLAAVCLLLMLFQVTLDVVLRFFFKWTVIGTLETVSFYYMVGLVFLSFAFVELRHQNVRVDLFVQLMPPTLQLWLYVASCLFGLAFFGMLGWQTFQDAMRATARGETAMANFVFPIWPARWALPFGFLGLCLALLSNMIKALREARPL
ncbi:TRAP transporter small permease [Nitratireductor sp. ZSWI3]|uniref:TRAP transporter small permease n=1 Tax=Nitratireductor sp. ZSWI3 TaxID=2966359 RepID=UPI002150256D|nr:TRAP transporter small permease subunit [Nitratireductor sp. ZSWI3]MCR4265560.1 TRAP transporter small permease subunit [Nitratireductor sp. ZSWI3]